MKSRVSGNKQEIKRTISLNDTSFKYELSIGIIVKNEAKDLLRCIQSLQKLRDAIPCQLIITDTGSTDGTKEIAKQYADVYLEFEWCNDFSAARNTGVEVAEGRWFAYFDADEFLDSNCDDLIEFFKSPEHNKNEYVVIVRRDYDNHSFSAFSDIKLHRFYNFSFNKSYFKDIIHEYLPTQTTYFYKTSTIIHHTGYIGPNKLLKIKRNEEGLYIEIAKDPLDVRAYMHLGTGKSDASDRISVFEECLSYVEDMHNPPKKLHFQILSLLAKEYLGKSLHKKLDLLVEDYINTNTEKIVPNLEILYFLATSKQIRGEFELAIRYFTRYQELYCYLQENIDSTFHLSSYTNVNKEYTYLFSFTEITLCYISVNDNENAYKSILKCNPLTYRKDGDLIFLTTYIMSLFSLKKYEEIREVYDTLATEKKQRVDIIYTLESYLNPTIFTESNKDLQSIFCKNINDGYIVLNALRASNFRLDKLDDSIIESVESDELVYTSSDFHDFVYFMLLRQHDDFDILIKCNHVLMEKYITRVYKKYATFPYLVKQYIDNIDLDSITDEKHYFFIKNLTYMYLINITNVHQSINITDSDIISVFETYVNASMKILASQYDMTTIMSSLNFLSDIYKSVLCFSEANIRIDSNQVEYIKFLKKGLSYDSRMYKCVEVLCNNITLANDNAQDDREEFLALAKQIKEQVKNYIKNGDTTNAKMFLEEYININPTDKEIGDLCSLINVDSNVH